jgi:hypothetical protein
MSFAAAGANFEVYPADSECTRIFSHVATNDGAVVSLTNFTGEICIRRNTDAAVPMEDTKGSAPPVAAVVSDVSPEALDPPIQPATPPASKVSGPKRDMGSFVLCLLVAFNLAALGNLMGIGPTSSTKHGRGVCRCTKPATPSDMAPVWLIILTESILTAFIVLAAIVFIVKPTTSTEKDVDQDGIAEAQHVFPTTDPVVQS